MVNFFKTLAAARAAQKRQRIGPCQFQTFILEEILTPSGLLDNGDDILNDPLPQRSTRRFPISNSPI